MMSPSKKSRDKRYPYAVMYKNMRDAALLAHGIKLSFNRAWLQTIKIYSI